MDGKMDGWRQRRSPEVLKHTPRAVRGAGTSSGCRGGGERPALESGSPVCGKEEEGRWRRRWRRRESGKKGKLQTDKCNKNSDQCVCVMFLEGSGERWSGGGGCSLVHELALVAGEKASRVGNVCVCVCVCVCVRAL